MESDTLISHGMLLSGSLEKLRLILWQLNHCLGIGELKLEIGDETKKKLRVWIWILWLQDLQARPDVRKIHVIFILKNLSLVLRPV